MIIHRMAECNFYTLQVTLRIVKSDWNEWRVYGFFLMRGHDTVLTLAFRP